jgi:hypothetical protein
MVEHYRGQVKAHKLARAACFVMRDQVPFDPASVFGYFLKPGMFFCLTGAF